MSRIKTTGIKTKDSAFIQLSIKVQIWTGNITAKEIILHNVLLKC